MTEINLDYVKRVTELLSSRGYGCYFEDCQDCYEKGLTPELAVKEILGENDE
jgi:hypothetical protein